jgi:hypothetical protein
MSKGFKGEIEVEEFVYDFAVDGGAIGFIDLSAKAGEVVLDVGTVIEKVEWKVITAPTSAGAATISVGDNGSNARYKALTAFNNAAYLVDQVSAGTGVPYLATAANDGKFGMAIAVAALTAGKIVFMVTYYKPSV